MNFTTMYLNTKFAKFGELCPFQENNVTRLDFRQSFSFVDLSI